MQNAKRQTTRDGWKAVQRLSRYASQGRSARAVLTRKHNHPSTPSTTFFCSFLAACQEGSTFPSLAIQAHVTISVNNQSIPRDLTPASGLLYQTRSCFTSLPLLPETPLTHAFACRNARQQTVKSDKVDVVVVVCIPPPLNKRPRPASVAYYSSLLQPLTQTSHHQILLCRHVIITRLQSLTTAAD